MRWRGNFRPGIVQSSVVLLQFADTVQRLDRKDVTARQSYDEFVKLLSVRVNFAKLLSHDHIDNLILGGLVGTKWTDLLFTGLPTY